MEKQSFCCIIFWEPVELKMEDEAIPTIVFPFSGGQRISYDQLLWIFGFTFVLSIIFLKPLLFHALQQHPESPFSPLLTSMIP